MDNNQRPHSRQKTVGSGSAGVGKGRQVTTGSRPVGSGGRTGSGGTGGTGGRPARGAGGGLPIGKLSLKKILIIAAVIILAVVVLKKIGGSGSLSGLLGDPGVDFGDSYSDSLIQNNTNTNTNVNAASASYSKPDYKVSPLARDKFYTPVGGGRDTVTVMVYMCGTDLESKYGMATKDLQEMLSATIAKNVNIIVLTGGCKAWKNSEISSSKNQIFKVENKKLVKLEDNFGTKAMTDPDNLTNFIDYCEENYDADRNMLILWDHGGGSLTGYGYDEKSGSSASMTLSKINGALKKAGCKFDFIGFDACLMATLETALVCESYADYLIGSEETEPGTGWYYTKWLTKLSENTSIPTVELASYIIDDFVASCCSSTPSAKVTLSVTDLSELAGTVPESFRDFAASTNEMIRSDDYKQISDARAGARQFSASSKLNQVDMIDFAERIGTDESNALAKALQSCVKYNKTTIARSHGLSIYFPYETTRSVKSAVASYNDLGIDSEYTKCIQSFASLETGGQIAASASQLPGGFDLSGGGDLLGSLLGSFLGGSTTSSSSSSSGGSALAGLAGSLLGGSSSSSSSSSSSGGSALAGLAGSLLGGSSSSTSPLDVLTGSFFGGSGGSSSAGMSIDPSVLTSLLGGFSGRSMPEEYDWIDTELIADKAESIANGFVDPGRITATEKNGGRVLTLTDAEWANIQTVELNVFVKDGDGYIDMGLDNTFDFDDDGDLLLTYDGTWLTINGNACAYYLVSDTELEDGSYVTVGRIPALLNGDMVNLNVVFDDEHPEGVVTGAYPIYENDSVSVQAKGDIVINEGDTIELLCDYYNENGEYSASYTLGTQFTVPAEGLALTNLKLDVEEVSATYRLTDIYGNHFWISVE